MFFYKVILFLVLAQCALLARFLLALQINWFYFIDELNIKISYFKFRDKFVVGTVVKL